HLLLEAGAAEGPARPRAADRRAGPRAAAVVAAVAALLAADVGDDEHIVGLGRPDRQEGGGRHLEPTLHTEHLRLRLGGCEWSLLGGAGGAVRKRRSGGRRVFPGRGAPAVGGSWTSAAGAGQSPQTPPSEAAPGAVHASLPCSGPARRPPLPAGARRRA